MLLSPRAPATAYVTSMLLLLLLLLGEAHSRYSSASRALIRTTSLVDGDWQVLTEGHRRPPE